MKPESPTEHPGIPSNSTPVNDIPSSPFKVKRQAVVACGCGLYIHRFPTDSPNQTALLHAKATGHTCELKIVYRVRKEDR